MLSEGDAVCTPSGGSLQQMPAQNDTFMNSATQHRITASGT